MQKSKYIFKNAYKDDDNALIAYHIHKSFKRGGKQKLLLGKYHDAVESVSMNVKRGEIYGLAGHNGAGKSTTLGVITGAVKMDKPGYRIFANTKRSK